MIAVETSVGKADLLAFGVFEIEEGNKVDLPYEVAKVDKLVGNVITKSIEAGEFEGKESTSVRYNVVGIPARVVALFGLGKKADFSLEVVRSVAAKFCAVANASKAKHAAFYIDNLVSGKVDDAAAGMAFAEGAILGGYEFKTHKEKKEKEHVVEKFAVVTMKDPSLARKGIEKGEIIAESTNIARELCNGPANIATPAKVASEAMNLAKKYGFKCRVMEKAELDKERMGGILAIAAGSIHAPKMVVMEHNGAKGNPIVLIGKGLTFDSGGINLKPGKALQGEKFDKSGACAVIGTMVAISRLKMKKNVVALAPLVENMPSGTAAKPGDIIRSRSGKTIEIDNTDAEGRVVLADALDYAKEFKPSTIIDIATLTGACVVALGYEASGLLGNDDTLMKEIEYAGSVSGEHVWPLPTWKEYDEYNKSDVADVKNTGLPGAAGTIEGAKFLQVFVPEGVPWAHLDICGTAQVIGAPKAYLALGATGVGVRLFTALLEKI